MFPDASDIELIAIYAQFLEFFQLRLFLYVWLEARSPCPLLGKRVKPWSDGYLSVCILDLELIRMRPLHHPPVQQRVALHVLFCYLPYSPVLRPLPPVNQINPQPFLSLLKSSRLWKRIDNLFGPIALIVIISGDAMHSNIFLIERWSSESIQLKWIDGISDLDFNFVHFELLVLDQDHILPFLWSLWRSLSLSSKYLFIDIDLGFYLCTLVLTNWLLR